jgi:hypothetical protein
VNITVFEETPPANGSFSFSFGAQYKFPPPIAVDQNQVPASCRLLNPSQADKGSEWTCQGRDARFRVDTGPDDKDPIINQLFSSSNGICDGKADCGTQTKGPGSGSNPVPPPDDTKISLGLLGTFDKGPVIASFTIVGLLLIGIIATWYYRSRHKSEEHIEGPISRAKKSVSWYHFFCHPCLPISPKPRTSSALTPKGPEIKKDKKTKKSQKKIKETLVQITPPLPGSKLLESVGQTPSTSSASSKGKAKMETKKATPIKKPDPMPKLPMIQGPSMLQILESKKNQRQTLMRGPVPSNSQPRLQSSHIPKPKRVQTLMVSSAASDTGSDNIPIGALRRK